MDLQTDHEQKICKQLEINECSFLFMESLRTRNHGLKDTIPLGFVGNGEKHRIEDEDDDENDDVRAVLGRDPG